MALRRHVASVLLGIVLLVLPAAAHAATLPTGFQETVVFSGLTNPTAVRFAADGRVFVAEKSGLIKVFDDLDRPDADGRSPTCARTSTTSGTAACSAWRSTPNFPADPYVYVLYTHDAAIGGIAPRWGIAGRPSDACPTPPGADDRRLRRLAAGSRGSRLRQRDDRHRAGADRGLVPAVPEPLGRQPRVRRRRRALRHAAATAPASTSPTTARTAARSTRAAIRPAARLDADAADRRGRRAAQPGPAHAGDPAALDGAILRVDPATGAGTARQPARGSADPNARRIIAHGLRNPFRFTVRPGTNEIWVGDVGWNTWEEIDRLAARPTARRELRLAVLRGRRPRRRGYDARQPEHLREPVRGRRRAPSTAAVLHLQPRRARSSPARPARPAARRSPGSRSTRAATTRGLPRRALLRRLLARLHLGRCCRARTACPTRATGSTFVAGAAESRRPRDRPGRRPLLRRLRRRHDPPDPLLQRATGRRPRSRTANPTSGAGPADGHTSTARGSTDPEPATRSPTPGISTATARSTTRPRRSRRFTYTTAGDLHRAAARHRRAGASTDSDRSRSRVGNTRRRRRSSTRRPPGTTWSVGDVISFSGSRDRPAGGHAAGHRAELGAGHAPLPARTATQHPLQTFAASRAARSSRPTTSTRRTSSSG